MPHTGCGRPAPLAVVRDRRRQGPTRSDSPRLWPAAPGPALPRREKRPPPVPGIAVWCHQTGTSVSFTPRTPGSTVGLSSSGGGLFGRPKTHNESWGASYLGRLLRLDFLACGTGFNRSLARSCSAIQFVRGSEPAPHFIINRGQAADLDAMGDAVALVVAPGINQPLGRLAIAQRETEIDPRVRGGFELGKDCGCDTAGRWSCTGRLSRPCPCLTRALRVGRR